MLLVRNETKCLKEFKRFVFFYDRLIRRIQVLLSIVIFGERPKLMQLVGIIICIIAVILINFEKEQTVISFKLGLILTLIVSGFCEGMSKVHEELGNSILSEYFLLYTFGVALICAIVLIVIRKEPFAEGIE